jgi:release factor glutamine methyltransferase
VEGAGTIDATDARSRSVVARLRASGCVFAEDEARLLIADARSSSELVAMLDRRAAGIPLEYVLGWAEFCGVRIQVEPGVFVPRRRTEFLVHEAVAAVRSCDASRVVVDLCCGSGAVGAAVLEVLDGVELHAADIDPAAARCARSNLGSDARVYEGDLFTPLPVTIAGRVDVIVANVPYVPTGAVGSLPAEARDYEAPVALDGGADGLDVVRRVAAEAPRWLAPGGHLLIETAERQAGQAVAIFQGHGLGACIARSEELSATVAIGTKRS